MQKVVRPEFPTPSVAEVVSVAMVEWRQRHEVVQKVGVQLVVT